MQMVVKEMYTFFSLFVFYSNRFNQKKQNAGKNTCGESSEGHVIKGPLMLSRSRSCKSWLNSGTVLVMETQRLAIKFTLRVKTTVALKI